MNTIHTLDCAVVYSSDTAQSAGNYASIGENPFARDQRRSHYALSYGYLLDQCEQNGLRVAFTTSDDIVGPGMFDSYWEYSGGEWFRNSSTFQTKILFDKFTPTTPHQINQKKLLASSGVNFFNHLDLSALFHDKLAFYNTFADVTIPTVSLDDYVSVSDAIEQLKHLIHISGKSEDFSDSLILKDRFGAGGNNIYKIDRNYSSEIVRLIASNPEKTFVLQPFVLFDKGMSHRGYNGCMDLRVILLKQEIVQSYIRVAGIDDFRCNEHQGADLIYIDIEHIPQDVQTIISDLSPDIPGIKPLYALDFIRSNNGTVYLVEGNHSPGLDYAVTKPENKMKAEELIDIAVAEIERRVYCSKNNRHFAFDVMV